MIVFVIVYPFISVHLRFCIHLRSDNKGFHLFSCILAEESVIMHPAL